MIRPYVEKTWTQAEVDELRAKREAQPCTCDRYHPHVWGAMGGCERHGVIGIPWPLPPEPDHR